MSIYGIGTDIININRIKEILNKPYYRRFCYRILSPREIEEYNMISDINRQSIYLAKRFSTKEALMKALGTGYRFGIAFSEIEIVKDELGKPIIKLLGKTLQIAENIIKREFISFISWSDEDHYILSFAVIQII